MISIITTRKKPHEPHTERQNHSVANCLRAVVGRSLLMLPMAMTSAVAQLLLAKQAIRIVVAFAAGADRFLRPALCEQLTAKFGVPAIVENKPGAGAIIARDCGRRRRMATSPLMTTSARFGRTACCTASCRMTWTSIIARGFFPSGPLGGRA
jgi:hypothetical protein